MAILKDLKIGLGGLVQLTGKTLEAVAKTTKKAGERLAEHPKTPNKK